SAVVLGASSGVAVDWRIGSSRDLDADIAPLDLVVMGRSFHWMDREATLALLDSLVERHGAIALLSTESLPGRGTEWSHAYEAVRAEFAREDEFERHRKTPLWAPHHAVLLGSPFSVLDRFGVIEERTVSLDGLIARALSQSTTTTAALGERREAFVR